MKLAPLVFIAATANGFAPVVRHQRPSLVTVPRMTGAVTSTESDFASAMPDAMDPYERLGVSKDQVALGVDVNEILQWIGTRDDIIEKCVQDNPSFTQERAEMEVDKFLMDAEMMSAYISYEKRKASGALQQEGEANLSTPWGTYVTWFFGIYFLNYLRRTYIDPKFASGEWKLPFGGDGGSDAATDAVTSVADTATHTLSSVQGAIDIISDAM